MDLVASLLWNPVLALLYLAVGIAFLLLTGAVAWRRSLGVFSATWASAPVRGHGYELGHREAFVSSLAATVGVGNLAGVGTALHLGGPGALFWIWVSGALGMSFRMASVYLSRRLGPRDEDHPAYATPMAYLEHAGGPFAGVVAVLFIASGLVNSNLIQANSVAHTLSLDFGIDRSWVAVGLALAVAAVVIGGLRSLVTVSVAIAPFMMAIYLLIGLGALTAAPLATLRSLGDVLDGALGSEAALGGAAGYTVMQAMQYGTSRGVFSHGAGIGMAPFFQSRNSDEPGRSAMMAAVVPAVDTLVVCSITGLVVVTYGRWETVTGAHLTVSAFGNVVGSTGQWAVLGCLGVFAFTTVASWAHFSERCFVYLGGRDRVVYRVVFCCVTLVGPLLPLRPIWSLADIIIGLLVLAHLLPMMGLMARHANDLDAALETLGPPEPAAPEGE